MMERIATLTVAGVMTGVLLGGCGAPPEAVPDPAVAERRVPEPRPIPNCSPAAGTSTFLVRDSQNCWYQTPHGRWRIVNHELHYDMLVVRVMAEHLDVAGEVGERFVELHRERFREMVIFVVEETDVEPPPIRRVTWTRAGGFEYLDFASLPVLPHA
jgi:hypothetical protein